MSTSLGTEPAPILGTPTDQLLSHLRRQGWHRAADNQLVWCDPAGRSSIAIPTAAHRNPQAWSAVLRTIARAQGTTSSALAQAAGLPPAHCESCRRLAPCRWVRLGSDQERDEEVFGVCDGCRPSPTSALE